MQSYPDGVRREKGPGGLERLVLQAAEGEAVVYLHGGHVAEFRPTGGKPVLWLSGASRFEAGAPIRGGVPICFPWFGKKDGAADAPPHGFARLVLFALGAVSRESDGRLRAVLELPADAAARAGLSLSLAVTVGRSLNMELTVQNMHGAPATFEQALHSYFAVSDARQIRIRGLEGAPYLDAVAPMARKPGEAAPIVIAAETDRVYGANAATVTIEDPGWHRRIVVAKSGSRTTVVWNPWIAKSKAMPDFGDDEWPGMVCVETANAKDDAVTLAPGASHVMTATLGVEAD